MADMLAHHMVLRGIQALGGGKRLQRAAGVIAGCAAQRVIGNQPDDVALRQDAMLAAGVFHDDGIELARPHQGDCVA